MNGSMRIARRAIVVAALGLFSTLANCSDSTRAGGDGPSQLDPRLRGIFVSGPLSSKSHASAARAVGAVGAAGAAGTTVDSQVVYVSLPSGSVEGGDSALIHDASRASTITRAPMIDGGFDPVAIYASADDSLDILLIANDGRVAGLVRAPAFRQPSVIRTTPARGRTDVPLSQIITIVFSQPIADSSVTGSSVKLTDANGAAVATTISFDAVRPWVVVLTPQAPLAPSSTYRILVDATVTDINGAALAAPLTSSFTTASSSSSSSDLLVLPQDGCGGAVASCELGSAMEATVGATVSFSAYWVTSGDTVSYAPQGLGWSTADMSVATVDSSGTVTAIAAGQTTVSACLKLTCGHADILTHAVQTTGVPAIDINSLAGGDFSEITSMAGEFAAGTALMRTSAGIRLHAFLWSASRGLEDLGAPAGAPLSNGAMVATNGDVVGTSDIGIGWRWTRATGIQSMPNPDLVHTWNLRAINGLGEIAYSTPDGSRIGFWSPTTGGSQASASGVPVFVNGMNDAAQMVVIESSAPSWFPGTTAYVWDARAGRYTDTLTTNGAIPGPAWTIWPSAINNLGVIAGIVWGATETRMFRWSRGKGFSFLTVPNGSMTSRGPALNEDGDVTFITEVFTNLSTGTTQHDGAGVWMADGRVLALQSLGGAYTEVTGVNGQSLAGGFSQVGSSNGPTHAVLWNLKAAPAPAGAKASADRSAPSHVAAPARRAATPKPPLSPPTSGRPP
ncbi:MAG TPA: Ig-like domain-containing protein [Gemmatimonadaceae bacterium]|nr:Ig-like domain-containing protein [Gemmatimonadaceae bacterium]